MSFIRPYLALHTLLTYVNIIGHTTVGGFHPKMLKRHFWQMFIPWVGRQKSSVPDIKGILAGPPPQSYVSPQEIAGLIKGLLTIGSP